MPDLQLGERACAFLVAAGPELTLRDVQRHLDALGVATYKWPERLEWVSDLPCSKVNKVDKKALRERATAIAQNSGQVTPLMAADRPGTAAARSRPSPAP